MARAVLAVAGATAPEYTGHARPNPESSRPRVPHTQVQPVATSNRIAQTTEIRPTVTPPGPVPTSPPGPVPTSPPAVTPPSSPPTPPPAPAPSAVRLALSRMVARDAVRAALSAGSETPQLWVAVSTLFADARAGDWQGVVQDLELIFASLGVTLTPSDRAKISDALQIAAETSVLTEPVSGNSVSPP